MTRMDAAIALAAMAPPALVRADAADFVRTRLAASQSYGVTRTLFHTVVWQYLPETTQADITAMMEEAGRHATPERPLAWVTLETNRATFQHELYVRRWRGDGEDRTAPVLLARAHPHGAWIEWLGEGAHTPG